MHITAGKRVQLKIQYVEDWINNLSMKILGWKYPNQVFQSQFLRSAAV